MTGPEGEKAFIAPADQGMKVRTPSFYPVPPEYFVTALRNYLRDFRNRNFLFKLDFAHTDEQLREAWGRALLDFNETPPVFSRQFTFTDCPRYILLKKAASEALMSLVNYMQINQTAYQDGEQSFQINQQWENIIQQADRLSKEANTERQRVKAQINANLVFFGSHSEFGNYFRDLGAGGPDPKSGSADIV